MKPVACFIRPDLAPRGAVRKVGPRPDLTRSARMDEPGGMAIRPGDRTKALPRPPEAAYQPTGGRWKKNGGSNASPLDSPIGNGRLATTRRPFFFSASVLRGRSV